MRRICGVLLLALALPAHAVTVGDTAPALAAPRENGEPLRLQDLQGRVVFVDFWASWCPPCRQSMPEYEKLWREFEPQGLSVVGVNLDSERTLALRALKQSPVSFPVVFDSKAVWPRRFDLPAMPTAYLIDRRGVVRHVHQGFRGGDIPALRALIHGLLQEAS